MRTNIEFKATGGELFKQLFVGFLLCSVTFGIYYPWFLVSLHRLVLNRTTVRVGDQELRLDFTGTGGELFKHMFLSYLFTMWTFGIYMPWAIVRLLKFQQEHTVAVGVDRTYRFQTELTGGQLFKTLIGGYLLTGITFGIYAPWFLANLMRTILEASSLRSEHEHVGSVRFTLTGGELFKRFIVGYLLTMVTFGVYMFWFQVKMLRLFMNSTEITAGGRAYRGDFTGTGGEAFKVNFLGYLLTMVTFGIYSFWYMANLLRFQFSNTRFLPAEELESELAAGVAPVRSMPTAPARAAFSQVSQPAQRRLPSQAASASASASAFPAIEGDRRAAWARAFLPPPSPGQQEWASTIADQSEVQIDVPEVWTDRASARSIN